jgi:glutamate/tyrosine decarboxylase-like PLP-dependent enzyme
MKTAFPETGKRRDEVLAALHDQRTADLKSDGRAFAFVYDAGDEVRDLAREAFAACMTINGLDPTVYPSARRIENQVIAACLEITQAPEGAVGTATAGGTESVMLAVKTARDYFAKRGGPRAQSPKMLLPETAHACFHKAAHYFGVEVVPVAVDPETFRADMADARAKMSDDVVLVVGSAPSYAHGVIDPIEQLAQLAAEHGVLMHVDACVGGCVLPFMRDNGVELPAFDFAVEGVTSMSMDLHKYGFAPKGISVLLQRRRDLRDAQYYACANWTGYSIVNSTTLGSKSVAAMGAAFALLHHLGREGYRERARTMWDATGRLVTVIDELDGVSMLGRPQMNLFAFTTSAADGKDAADVFELADRLTERGWHVQPTYAFGCSPAHIHLTIDPGNAARVDAFADDLRACMVDLPDTQQPPEGITALLEVIAQGGDDAGVDPGMLMAQLGISDGQLPTRSAPIHRLLNAASPAAREQLLVLFIGELFS